MLSILQLKMLNLNTFATTLLNISDICCKVAAANYAVANMLLLTGLTCAVFVFEDFATDVKSHF